MKFRLPRVPLLLLFMYFCSFFACGVNWWWWVSNNRGLLSDRFADTHLAFVITGSLLFALVGSPFLFWPYRYGAQMLPRSRRNCVFVAMTIAFLFHDMPLWFLEFWFVYQYGWISVTQGVSIVLLTFSFSVGLIAVWLGYAWKMSKLCQLHFGSANYNLSGAAGATGLGGLPMARVAGAPNQRI